jgi:hypothetical protein
MHQTSADIFAHVRIVMGFVISLSIARLLTGATRFIQHPSHYQVYPVHLVWSASIFLMLIHFWWWEFWLSNIEQWNFLLYSFLVAYATAMFMICTLLYPDSIAEYSGYEDYFYSRRRWFFGLFALTFVFDFADTLAKGEEHLSYLGVEYLIRAPVYVVLSLIAMWTANRNFHWAFAILNLAYQISFVTRLFMTLV